MAYFPIVHKRLNTTSGYKIVFLIYFLGFGCFVWRCCGVVCGENNNFIRKNKLITPLCSLSSLWDHFFFYIKTSLRAVCENWIVVANKLHIVHHHLSSAFKIPSTNFSCFLESFFWSNFKKSFVLKYCKY